MALFRAGEWLQLLREAEAALPRPAAPPSPATASSRAARATALVQQGELSAASRALTAEPLAPLNPGTLAELRDPQRRPATRHSPLSAEVSSFQLASPLHLDVDRLLSNLRRSRCRSLWVHPRTPPGLA